MLEIRQQIEKIGTTLHVLLFAMFCVDRAIYLFIFLTVFFVFFMFTIFGIPIIESRKKKEESSPRPATRIFVRK